MYFSITYNVTSTTQPTQIAYHGGVGDEIITPREWIDHITYGSPTGATVTLEGSEGTGYTFPSTGLQTLYIYPTGNTIPYFAFYTLDAVQEVTFYPENQILSIGKYAFGACESLTTVTTQPYIQSIGTAAFMECTSLQSFVIPSSVTSLEKSTFEGCTSLTAVSFNSQLTSIGQDCFNACYSLSSLTHQGTAPTITNIDSGAFRFCYSLPSLMIGNSPLLVDGLQLIDNNTFDGCSGITGTITIPDSVSGLGINAFNRCTGITDVYAGSGLCYLGQLAFGNCTSLSAITATSVLNQTVMGYKPFYHVKTGGTLYYPQSRSDIYEDIWLSDDTDFLGYYGWNGVPTGDTPPSERSVYLDPTEKTFPASTNNTGNNLRVLPSGCTIDSSYAPTYVSSADWLHADRHTWSSLESGWTIYYGPDRNTTNQTREGYITVNGVHDTDGNVYNGLVCHVIQYSGSYVFANYTSSVSSAETDTTVEIVGVNTNICSVTVTGFTGYPANRWEGFEQPSYTQLGNYITVHIPENDVTGSSRSVRFSAVTVYGESCENTEQLLISIGQAKSGATPTPVQKDIKAADADYSVGSGSGNASTTIQTSGCTYDHFTYITGGSFSVTANSGPDNTIVFTYPENPTTSPRTGYVYITFYDSDGNSYGPQTITFTQQAGSSPGPGPGPDPSTGYVLTTLTISDQEQHRYFVEARPGVVYSAAGQYYKTILACEARYSLYYVNSYGGVDVLPFKEKGWKKSDTITRFNYSKSFRNNTPEWENVNYLNSIEEEYELHTGWMSDEQSMRMHELVESTIVYLYDALEKTYIPVVMSDKKLEYKTYHNQGKKFYNYTVNCKASQSRERR